MDAAAAIEQAMHSGREQTVTLSEPIPVFILYLTAWAEQGRVKFLDDIYGHDAAQGAALRGLRTEN